MKIQLRTHSSTSQKPKRRINQRDVSMSTQFQHKVWCKWTSHFIQSNQVFNSTFFCNLFPTLLRTYVHVFFNILLCPILWLAFLFNQFRFFSLHEIKMRLHIIISRLCKLSFDCICNIKIQLLKNLFTFKDASKKIVF